MLFSDKIQKELNKQINKEFYSEYTYLSMTAYFESINLDGFANFFYVQAQEEHFHAMKMFNFVHRMGGVVTLTTLEGPPVKFDSILDTFKKALKQEEEIKDSIDNLVNLAKSENNHAVETFLQWYVDEQVEEIDLFNKRIGNLEMINGEGHGLLMMDTEFAQRKPDPEVLTGQMKP